MRIDAHQHFWRYTPERDGWITPEMAVLRRDFLPAELAPLLATSRMDGCIAVQADQSEDETRFLLGLAQEHPFILGVVGWVDLRRADVAERLAEFASNDRFCGVRHIVQAEADDRFLLQDDFVRGIGALASFDLTYDLLVVPRQLPAARDLAERLPGQRFVLDHLGKPPIRSGILEPWASDLRALAEHPNVWCKLSGLITEADWVEWSHADLRPYLDVAFEAFGAGRLMFGSDWPVCLLAGSHARATDAVAEYCSGFSAGERAAIFGGTAATCYRLGG